MSQLPHELQCLILYRHGGLEHPTARIMKPLIKAMQLSLLYCCECDADCEFDEFDDAYRSDFDDNGRFCYEISLRLGDKSNRWVFDPPSYPSSWIDYESPSQS